MSSFDLDNLAFEICKIVFILFLINMYSNLFYYIEVKVYFALCIKYMVK